MISSLLVAFVGTQISVGGVSGVLVEVPRNDTARYVPYRLRVGDEEQVVAMEYPHVIQVGGKQWAVDRNGAWDAVQ